MLILTLRTLIIMIKDLANLNNQRPQRQMEAISLKMKIRGDSC